ncbi:MAG: hypothetical protein KBC91_01825, partial [Candidatus Omnitrophica bacterium]|nr:hypothetical protein [Candidatus Omnitrophota bacterium]
MGFTKVRRNPQPVKSIKKFTASISLFLFLLNQMVPPAVSSVMTADEKTFSLQAVSLQDAAQQESVPAAEPSVKDSTVQTTQDFMSLTETLKAASKEEAEKKESSDVQSDNEIREYPAEYDFAEALEQLAPDYASAVIVKSVTAEELKKLTELQMEVGFAVVNGKLVLFTSGNEDEIRLLDPVKNLLDQAEFFGHVHPLGQRGEPSLTDIEEAGVKTEYVISADGVYSYNKDG